MSWRNEFNSYLSSSEEEAELYQKELVYFFLSEYAFEANLSLAWIVYSATKVLQEGSLCLDERTLNFPFECDEKISFNSLLKKESRLFSNGERETPLIIVENRLYFNKFYKLENRVVAKLKTLSERDLAFKSNFFLLGEREVETKAVTFLTGGPGTGKTTLIDGMLKQLLKENENIKIALLAPTGQARSRMVNSLSSDVKEDSRIVEGTIHKVLKISSVRNTPYNRKNPLPFDFIIVDESSMVSAPLMLLLLEAGSEESGIFFVGDSNQIPSVEVGNILGDILKATEQKECEWLKKRVVTLNKNYRSNQTIIEIAKKVLEGETFESPPSFLQPLPQSDFLFAQQIHKQYFETVFNSKKSIFEEEIEKYPLFEKEILSWLFEYSNVGILSPNRKGSFGVNSLNKQIGALFSQKEAIFAGAPIVITQNDYRNNLNNGERGVVLQFKTGLYCFFNGVEEKHNLKMVPLQKLESFDLAFVQTIHKSQGSEYETVVLIVPPLKERGELLLHRQILYTGITRGKEKLLIYGALENFNKSIITKSNRNSGVVELIQKS